MKALLVKDMAKFGAIGALVRAVVRMATRHFVLTSVSAGGLAMGLVCVAAASIPLTIDTNDGFTFNGTQTIAYAHRPPKPGPPPLPPTTMPLSDTIPGPAPTVTLGYAREVQSTFINGCAPLGTPVFKTILQNINKADVFFTTNVTGAPQLVSVRVIIPGLVNDNGTTVLPFEENFNVSATITSNGTTTSVPLMPTTPPLGKAAAYVPTVALPENTVITGDVDVEVTVQGPVSPPVTVALEAAQAPIGACPGDTTQQGVATVELQNMSVALIVEPKLNELSFVDSEDQPADTVEIFALARNVEVRIAALQGLSDSLEELIAFLSTNPNPAVQPLIAALQGVLNGVSARLNALVPQDARYTVSGEDLGTGDVPATLTSVDAAGDPIESYDLTLRPGSPVRSVPIVFIRAGSRIKNGLSGGLLFVAAESGGSVRVEADGYSDGVAAVTGP